MKKKALLSSILTIALCLSLIAGSTFALFTSEHKVNVAVTSGTVDVQATVENLRLGTTLAKDNLPETSATQDAENSNIIILDKIVPGDYVTFDIRIHNASDVAVQYRTVITKVEDGGLWEGLVVTFDEVQFNGTNAVKSEWASMAVGCDDIIVSVKVALPEEAGNEYQHTSCKFAYTVEAVQGNAEVTSEWDGQTTTAITKNTEDGKYHITTAAELVWLMENTQDATSPYLNETIVLDNNIDLGGNIVKGFGSEFCNFAGSFDGKNHTISNFVIDRTTQDTYAGLFNYVTYGTISNLIVENATINGDQTQVGAIVGGLNDNATVKDCSVVNCTVVANRKIGGAVGYVAGATVENVSVKDTTIYVESTDAAQYGKVVGFENTGAVVNNVSDENVTIIFMARVNTLDAFTAAVNNAQISKIVLTGDITNETVPAFNGVAYSLSNRTLDIDFGGHTFTTTVNVFEVGSGANLTLSNGKIYVSGSNSNTNAYGIIVGDGGTLNINNGFTLDIKRFDTLVQYAIYMQPRATVNMNGGKIVIWDAAAISMSGRSVFNMNGGTIELNSIQAGGASTAVVTVGSAPRAYLNAGTITGKGYVYAENYNTSSEPTVTVSQSLVQTTTKGLTH